MMDFDYAAPETWHSRILSLQMRAEPHKIGGVVYVPESASESRWHELFGTPEKMAHMLPRALVACSDCILEDECIKRPDDASCLVDDEATLLEWLRGKAVKQ